MGKGGEGRAFAADVNDHTAISITPKTARDDVAITRRRPRHHRLADEAQPCSNFSSW